MNLLTKAMMVAVAATAVAGAQQAPNTPTTAKPEFGMRQHMMHGPGKWWRDADTVRQIGLNDNQAQQIEQIFMDHRMRLIDWVADLQKQELKLESALNADQPDEAQVSNQVDQVVTARGKLEKEHALMMLNIRRVLTPDQWKKLQSIRGDMAAGGVFFHRFMGPGHGPGPMTMPAPPPPPGSPQQMD